MPAPRLSNLLLGGDHGPGGSIRRQVQVQHICEPLAGNEVHISFDVVPPERLAGRGECVPRGFIVVQSSVHVDPPQEFPGGDAARLICFFCLPRSVQPNQNQFNGIPGICQKIDAGFSCKRKPPAVPVVPKSFSYARKKYPPLVKWWRSANRHKNQRRNQVQMKLDVSSLAHTKWECKYHIVFAPK